MATQAGDVELKIPKLRKGSFFPSILEPRRRIDQALYAVVMEAYVNGVSTRSVDDLVAALGVDSGISKSQVSRICGGLDEIVGAFRTRRLDHIEFPYVYLDATYLHVRNSASQVCSMAVVVAQARDMGFDGKTLIHPSQIDACNTAFTPNAEEVKLARRIVNAFDLPGEPRQGRDRP